MLCRCFDAFSAALASLRFFGGLAAAVPQAVEEVKQQRLEEIRSEERKNSALKERSYSLTVRFRSLETYGALTDIVFSISPLPLLLYCQSVFASASFISTYLFIIRR